MSLKQLASYQIGDLLSIELKSNGTLNGLFYCFDPESKSVIIESDDAGLIWINGRDIKRIAFVSNKSDNKSQSKPQEQSTLHSGMIASIESMANQILSNDDYNGGKQEISAEIKQIQCKLMNFLNEQQLNPHLDAVTNVIKIGSTLSINPPYDQNSCTSTNEIVLSTVLNLLEQFHAQKDNINETQINEENGSDDILDID